MSQIEQTAKQALGHHQAGEFQEAERLYREVLRSQPQHGDVNHNLGVLLIHAGTPRAALPYLKAAMDLDPTRDRYWLSYAAGLLGAGHAHDALTIIDEGKRRGLQGMEVDALRQRIAASLGSGPSQDEINRLAALFAANRHAEMEAAARQVIQTWPNHGIGWKALGAVLAAQQRFAEALPNLRKTVALQPSDAEAHGNLAHALQALGQSSEAEASCRRALALEPDYLEVHNTLGNALRDLGRPEEAGRCFRRALELNPDYPEAHNNLGNALRDLGRLEEAERSYRRALELKPDFAMAHSNLGNALKDLGHLAAAERSYRRALALNPEFAVAHSNLGNALKDLGRLEEAEGSFRRALELKPDFAAAHGNLIFALDLMERSDTREQQQERRRWYLQHGRKHAQAIRPHENVPDPERKLRVGYVSADFCRRSPYYAFGPVVCGHDRSAFEVVCYSEGLREDEATARLRRAAHEWRSTLGVSDEALAGQIRRDRIDILVDLSAHMAGSRLLVFARKPAPVQVTAWGYANGTGLQTMDYFFADSIAVPGEERIHFAEEVTDLPCIVCYEPPEYLPAVSPLPASGGKPFTFGCVNRLEKISARAIALWGRILAALPQARLLIKGWGLSDRELRENLLQKFGDAGIDAERVRPLDHSPHAEHLKIYHEVDLVLDPYPHGGGVSTLEALWMGVPVVTLKGLTPVSRVSASILTALRMQDWIAGSDEDYVRIAVAAARDLPRLEGVRQGLRARAGASVVGDLRRYTRAVEAAYRTAWRRWCAGSSNQ